MNQSITKVQDNTVFDSHKIIDDEESDTEHDDMLFDFDDNEQDDEDFLNDDEYLDEDECLDDDDDSDEEDFRQQMNDLMNTMEAVREPTAEQRLAEMVGLRRLKEEIAQARTLTRFARLRKRVGLEKITENRHHMLFLGNPGTGKTTVAKLIGEIYHDMGVLSKGHTIVADRSKLIGEFIGESESKVCNIIEEARGGVLFIDEAYTLFVGSNDNKDYGRRVVETLLPILSEPDPDMIIIFAGYEDKMQRLLSFNPGLNDRFPLHFHFDDFTADDLMDIMKGLCNERNYTLCEGTQEVMKDVIDGVLRDKNEHFGNGRWVHNFFEQGIVKAMAEHVMKLVDDDVSEDLLPSLLTDITPEYVRKAAETYAKPVIKKTLRRRIGFVA